MSSAAIQTPNALAKPFGGKAGIVYPLLIVTASLAICLFASTSRAETTSDAKSVAPASAAIVAALRPYAAEIGKSRRLIIHDVPTPAPAIAFSNRDGEAVSMTDLKGKVILLNFWATWCPPCLEEMPSLNALQQKLGGDDFEVVAVNVNFRGPDLPISWLEKHNIDALAFYHDRTMKSMRETGEAGLPVTILIDRAGMEVGRLAGEAEWDSEGAVEAIRLLIDSAPAEG